MAIEKTLRWIVLGGVFTLPFIVLIVSSSFFFPFITGKNFAFRIIVEIVTGAYLALALLDPAYRPKRSMLLGAFAFFTLIVLIADLFGAYPFKSIWSNFERMDGWVTLVHLFLYFVVASSVLNTEKLWLRFWQTTLGVSVLVGLYGLLQAAGVASLNPGFSSAARIDATFGNPIYLAAYMLFEIGIAAVLWARSWQASAPGRRTGPSLFYGGVMIFDAIILAMANTRGATVGLVAGALLFLLLAALSREVAPSARRVAGAVLAGLFFFAGMFFLLRDQAALRSIPILERLATISLDDNTTKARFYNWGMAWEGVKEHPILGWGQENYAVVFDKYYDPRMYAQEQWFDRVHNIVFDWLVAAGILGLFSYLSLYAAALLLLWRSRFEAAFTSTEKRILTALLAAYFVSIFFVFDNIASYILFASILAYISSRATSDAESLPLPTLPRPLAPVAALSAVVIVWGSAWYVNASAIQANRDLLRGLQPQQEGLQRNLDYFSEAAALRTIGTQEVREQLVQAAIQIAGAENVSPDIKQAFSQAAAAEMELMMEEAPHSARFPLFLGILYEAYGDYEHAGVALEKAHELSPAKQSILFELAGNAFSRGETTRALEIYREAYELAPEFKDARIYYAAAAVRLDQDALADELIAPILESGEAADPRLAAAYVSRARYDKVVALWEARIAANPNDIEAYFTLAAAYYGARNSAEAIAVLEEVGRIAPGSKTEADTLVQQIRAGTVPLQ